MSGLEHLVRYLGEAIQGLSSAGARAIYVAVLGILFLYSGAGKLRRPWLTAMAIVDFGATTHPHERLGRSLGVGECLLGFGLVLTPRIASPLMTVVAALAAVLLWIFAAAIARALRSGRSFACACFGNTDSPLSRLTLLRTTGLATLATFVAVANAVDPSPYSAQEWILAFWAGLAILAAVTLTTHARRIWHLPTPPAGEPTAATTVRT